MAPLPIKNIEVTQVDFNDYTYSIVPQPENLTSETLSKSLSRFGILNPPILREKNSEFYSIVAGRKQLLALRSLPGKQKCPCLLVPTSLPERDVFDILLAEIQLRRQLSPAEKVLFLQKLNHLVDTQTIIKKFMPLLELPPDAAALKQILKLLELEDALLVALHQNNLNEAVARDFGSLSATDRISLFNLIVDLRLSSSNQKKLIHICRELAAREDKSIAAILDCHEVVEILEHQQANPPQKTGKLMAWLTRRSRPRAMQAEEEYKRFIAGLKLPENVSISHAPFFEDDTVTLAVTFKNIQSLLHTWDKIKNETDKSST